MPGNHFSFTGAERPSVASGGSIEAEAVCSWGSAGRVGEIMETSGPRTYTNIKQRYTPTGRETHASLLLKPHQTQGRAWLSWEVWGRRVGTLRRSHSPGADAQALSETRPGESGTTTCFQHGLVTSSLLLRWRQDWERKSSSNPYSTLSTR